MQFHFTGRNNLEVTPALKTFTQEKLERLERLDTHIRSIDIEFRVEKLTHIVEATLHLLSGAPIRATAAAEENMYAAIDELVDKLKIQITKHKEKTVDDHR